VLIRIDARSCQLTVLFHSGYSGPGTFAKGQDAAGGVVQRFADRTPRANTQPPGSDPNLRPPSHCMHQANAVAAHCPAMSFGEG
jgi:hypothetical protein